MPGIQPRLPVFRNLEPEVVGQAPGLVSYLAEPGDERMVAAIGEETLLESRWFDGSRIDIVQGPVQRSASAVVTGKRYLQRDRDGRIIGALNVTLVKQGRETEAVASNIVVAEFCRRQGIATNLVAQARDDHPNLTVDSSMTRLGGAFFGYERATPESPALSTENTRRVKP